MRITLCGSTRFRDEYRAFERRLSLNGHVVYSCAVFRGDGGPELTAEEKERLDLVHLLKILNSDMVIVVGKGEDGKPYVGDSTRREIAWAQMLGKKLFFQEQFEKEFGPA